jgi:CheY-like chemotaxis protein
MAVLCDICKTVCRWVGTQCPHEAKQARAKGTFHVLLASSNAFELDSWVAELSEIDAELVKVENGKAALKAIKGQDFDVVVAAVSMAEKDGLELLKELSDLPRPPLRILVSRGCDIADRTYLRLALLYGADVTLTQPLESGALGSYVRKTPCPAA